MPNWASIIDIWIYYSTKAI